MAGISEPQRLYLHGLGQTPLVWEKTISVLGGEGYSVCPNLVGLVRGQEAAYQNLYAAVSGFCDQFKGSIDLCGLSLGGVLALNYAIEHPEKVQSLVLIAAQYKMPRGLLRLQNALFRFMPAYVFRQTGFGKAEFLRLCKSMMTLDFSVSIRNIVCPALVVCGERDSANKKAALELADIMPNAELQIISGSGHEVNLDAPEQLARVIRDFYDRFPVDKGGKVW